MNTNNIRPNLAQLAKSKKDSSPRVYKKVQHSIFYYMYKAFLLKYFSYKGRASRKEYWSFILLICLLYSVCFYIFFFYQENIEALILSFDIIGKITFIPTITIIIRRLHDFNKPGYWAFVPTLKILMFAFIKSDEDTNQFGRPE